ncbi:MAG: tol-pal system protein YbgF [Polyangiaceae bacterium]
MLIASGSVALAGSGLLGCAHTQAGEDRDMAKLRDDLSRVQLEHDQLDKRVDALEMHTGAAASDEPEPNPPPSSASRKNSMASSDATSTPTPKLRVVHLDADGSTPQVEAEEDPNDLSARPSIQLTGTASRGAGRGRALAAPAGSEIGEARKTGADAAAFDPQAKRAYDAALALAMAKKYDAALDGFAAFLVKWPDHPNADNATYWRGECYFAKGDFAHAAEQFEGTIARFPFGNKVPDALLKLGATYEKLGDTDRSQQALSRLTRDYPRSEAAKRLATNPAKKTDKSGASAP